MNNLDFEFVAIFIIINVLMLSISYLQKRSLLKIKNKETTRYVLGIYTIKENFSYIIFNIIILLLLVSNETTFTQTLYIICFCYYLMLMQIPYIVKQIIVNNKVFLLNIFSLLLMSICFTGLILEANLFIFFVLGMILVFVTPLIIPSPISLYNNIILKTSDKISSMLNAYTEEKFTYFFKIPEDYLNKDFKNILLQYAVLLGKNFIIENWDIFNDKAKYIIYNGWQGYNFFKKKKISYFEIYKEGKIIVYITPEDYKKIKEPVTFQELNIKLAESIENSFKEFLKENKEGAIFNLIGTKKYIPYYKSKQKQDENEKIFFLGGMFLCVFLFYLSGMLSSNDFYKIAIIFRHLDLFILAISPLIVAFISYIFYKNKLFTSKSK